MAEQMIYCGPAVPRGGLSAFAVFAGALPANVRKLAGECPELGRLIVPVGDLAETRRRVGEPGTEERRLHEAVKNHKWEASE